ncbi:MAG: DUF6345 domain-containing protein [Fibrobacterales bacterium]
MMKILFLVLSFTTIICAGGWGTLQYAWITSFSVESYRQVGHLSLPYSHENADAFVDNLKTRASAAGVSVRSNQSTHKYKDAAVTKSFMTGTTSNNSEFVFFSGHNKIDPNGSYDGGKLALGPICYDGGIVAPTDKEYGGSYTKWLFYDASYSLRYTLNNLLPVFDGLHAIFGYSSSVQSGYKNGNYSYEKWDEWSYQWIVQGKTMWEAYKSAIYSELYQDIGLSQEIKVVYVKGTADGVPFNGAEETFANVYNGRAVGAARQFIARNTVVYGTPTY